MSDSIVPFDFDGQSVRVVMRDGEPWFVASDVCRILEIGNPTMALARLDDDERTLISIEGGPPAGVNVVSESGLYSLVLGSRKPEARRFKRWVVREVVPSIRKTGSYGTPDIRSMLARPETAALVLAETLAVLGEERTKRIAAESEVVAKTEALAVAETKVSSLEDELRDAEPALELVRRWQRKDGNFGLQNASRAHGLAPRALVTMAKRRGDLFYEGGELVAKSEFLSHDGGRGYFDMVAAENHHTVRDDGTKWAGLQLVFTKKGWLWAPKRYGFESAARRAA